MSTETLAAWETTLSNLSTDLDFTDPDDRACFRLRVRSAAKVARRDLLVSVASQLGNKVAGNVTHHDASRAVADAWMNR